MLLLERRERGEIGSSDTARAMSYIESFLVRRMICRVPTNNLNRIFQAVPGQLPLDVPVADGLRQLLSAANRFWPDDDELREKIWRAPFYQYGRWHQRKLVLQRLEESYGHPEPVDFASARLTIEHVLPQSAGDEWMRMLSEDASDTETPEDLHARLRHTLRQPDPHSGQLGTVQPPVRAQAGSAQGQPPGDEPPHRSHRPVGRPGDPGPRRRSRRARDHTEAGPAARHRQGRTQPRLATGPSGTRGATARHLDVLRRPRRVPRFGRAGRGEPPGRHPGRGQRPSRAHLRGQGLRRVPLDISGRSGRRPRPVDRGRHPLHGQRCRRSDPTQNRRRPRPPDHRRRRHPGGRRGHGTAHRAKPERGDTRRPVLPSARDRRLPRDGRRGPRPSHWLGEARRMGRPRIRSDPHKRVPRARRDRAAGPRYLAADALPGRRTRWHSGGGLPAPRRARALHRPQTPCRTAPTAQR